jgi:pyridoxal phosphate enzyme (YggS family)|tara:strand:+ start:234 stop:887 length:654 start_codon:yes stop_codon:yes gene_type:complete
MINIVDNFKNLKLKINSINNGNKTKIIAVSKTFTIEHIKPLIDHGHADFGENKVQEAEHKWSNLKERPNLNLHMIGKLQSNKAKKALQIFDYIHSLDSQKLANTLSKYEKELNKKIKYFIQVNIGNESQKSGINVSEIDQFYDYCQKELNLDIIGLMAIPPIENYKENFKIISKLNTMLNLPELSLGMSNDYVDAINNKATYVRVGSLIFGQRSNLL